MIAFLCGQGRSDHPQEGLVIISPENFDVKNSWLSLHIAIYRHDCGPFIFNTKHFPEGKGKTQRIVGSGDVQLLTDY
jgi:hypothetical protein